MEPSYIVRDAIANILRLIFSKCPCHLIICTFVLNAQIVRNDHLFSFFTILPKQITLIFYHQPEKVSKRCQMILQILIDQIGSEMNCQRGFIMYMLFVCLITPLVLAYGQDTWSGQYESCYFQYGYNDPNLTQFRFDRCLWPICSQYITVANMSFCIYHTNITESSWSLCSLRCCYSSLPQSYQSFSQCEQTVETVSYILIAIFLSILVAIILIFVFKKLDLKSLRPNCDQCSANTCNNIKVFFQKIGVKIRWIFTCQCFKEKEPIQNAKLQNDRSSQPSTLTIEFIQKRQNTCGICNQQRPTIHLDCGHEFHRQCIAAHIGVKEQCPICHANTFNKATISCESCSSMFELSSLCQCFEDLRKNKQLCKLCIQREKINIL